MLLSASQQGGGSARLTAQQRPPSVYRISPKVDLPLTIGASLAVVLPYAFADRLIRPRCPCTPQEVNSFDRPAIGNTNVFAGTLSDATAGAVIILPLVADAFDVGLSHPLIEDGAVFTETLAVNGALVTAAKYIVQRPLPRTYAGDPNLINKPAGYRSFYSGHTSLVFAALSATAMTIRRRHGEKTWPWIVTGVVGASVAIERVADGRHFPTDVLVGAVIGTAIGIAVPSLHARKGSQGRGWTVGPTANGGIAVGWTWRF
jgi:membrane-associated phospholipid phosphatase